jgi:hypothetical protein
MSRLHPDVGGKGLPDSGQRDGQERQRLMAQDKFSPAHVGENFQEVCV